MKVGDVNSSTNISHLFKDPDDNPLTYSIAIVDNSISQVSINSTTGTAYITTHKADKTIVTITASDGISGEVSIDVDLIVQEKN